MMFNSQLETSLPLPIYGLDRTFHSPYSLDDHGREEIESQSTKEKPAPGFVDEILMITRSGKLA